MGRAEMRRAAREEKKKKVVYHLTQEQLDIMIARGVAQEMAKYEEKNREWLDICAKQAVGEEFAKVEEQVKNEAIVDAMRLTLAIPSEILRTKYWPKAFKKKLHGFIEDVLEMFRKIQDGEVTLEELEQNLWEYGGVRFEEK